ncbi:MAG: transcriptional regulator with domain and aminotransferase domain, partial [Herbinix sp.]|nr:transcriptional regulator with domain and aminotransferase domain [Herbinix sp.]
MLTYSFTELGSDSLYEHLYKCIKNDILQGVLEPGDRLPSKRSFAKHLNISTITIENSYAQLLAEGYIYSIAKKGYFVADIINSLKSSAAASQPKLAHNANKLAYYVDFLSNQTNPANFPFSIWAKLMREVISEKSEELMMNSPSGGIQELRVAIAEHLKAFRGMKVSPQQIVVGAGTEYLYGLLIQLLGHDKVYAVEDPGYQKVAQIYRSNHVSCCYVPMDKQGILISSLEEYKADIAHISPSHHYPTGIITPISRRYELLGWASKSKDRYIIEDDYDSEFRLLGKPIPSLQSIDVMEKVIYINTFSKSLAPTIRIGYMILPEHLVDKYHSELSFYSCTVSTFEQYTLAKFIRDGYFEKHINRMRSFYRMQRDGLLECIRTSPLSNAVTITEEDSGLHFLMELKTKLSDEAILRKAEQERIRLGCISQFYHNPVADMEHILVMNYSGIEADKMCEAIG